MTAQKRTPVILDTDIGTGIDGGALAAGLYAYEVYKHQARAPGKEPSHGERLHRWPAWNANTGRLPYHVHLQMDALIYSTAWNTARAAQGRPGTLRVQA